jgi:hypothetical protein
MDEGIGMSFFSEIKRRKVFRLAAAYIVIAWVIIQVVTAIEDPLQLPGWFDTAVIVLLGLGFPIAVSPDGKSVAFSTLNDRLFKKVSLSGGIPTPLGPTLGRFSYVTSRAHSYTPVR